MQLIAITDYQMFNLNKNYEEEVTNYRVTTPHGKGTVIRREIWGSSRLGIILDINPFWYSPVYYFRHEIIEDYVTTGS